MQAGFTGRYGGQNSRVSSALSLAKKPFFAAKCYSNAALYGLNFIQNKYLKSHAYDFDWRKKDSFSALSRGELQRLAN